MMVQRKFKLVALTLAAAGFGRLLIRLPASKGGCS